MGNAFTTKFIDFVWKNGGVFILVWIGGVRVVFNAKDSTVLGLKLNNAEWGLTLVLFSIFCLLAHSLFVCLLTRARYYDPKNLSPTRVGIIENLRTACKETPKFSLGFDYLEQELDAINEAVQNAKGEMSDLADDKGRTAKAYSDFWRKWGIFYANYSLREALDVNEKQQLTKQMRESANELLFATDWVKNCGIVKN